MIKRAEAADARAVAELALLLWPEHTREDLEQEMREVIADDNAVLFLYYAQDTPVGFAQGQLRQDYVEGTDSSPVGYLEGIYVRDGYKRRGIASALLDACEKWAAERGCTEFGSDCVLGNTDSIAFHLASGFVEANRLVCFAKELKTPGSGSRE